VRAWRALEGPGIFRIMRLKYGYAVALLACIACSTNSMSPAPADALPAVIQECETHTARVCGTWVRNAGTSDYIGSWAQGSKATITAVRWDEDIVEFVRRDTAGPTPSMQAHYLAIKNGRSVSFGQVRWINDGLTIFGTWDAGW
jgi:hypothetical protein